MRTHGAAEADGATASNPPATSVPTKTDRTNRLIILAPISLPEPPPETGSAQSAPDHLVLRSSRYPFGVAGEHGGDIVEEAREGIGALPTHLLGVLRVVSMRRGAGPLNTGKPPPRAGP